MPEPLYNRVAKYLKTENDPLPPHGAEVSQRTSLFVCHALAMAYREKAITAAELTALQGLLAEALPQKKDNPAYRVCDWLRKEGIIGLPKNHAEFVTLQMQIQAYRHRWLKHMCEEIKC